VNDSIGDSVGGVSVSLHGGTRVNLLALWLTLTTLAVASLAPNPSIALASSP